MKVNKWAMGWTRSKEYDSSAVARARFERKQARLLRRGAEGSVAGLGAYESWEPRMKTTAAKTVLTL